MKDIIRWASVLPAAVLGLLISYAVIQIIGAISGWFIGSNPDSPWQHLTTNVFVAGVSGFIFVYFGTKVAPSYKIQTAYALSGLLLLIGGALGLYNFSVGEWWSLVASITTSVGGLIALFQIHSGELNVEGDIFKFD